MTSTAFSPGKVILSGEHAVVAGYPAIAGCIDRGVTVAFKQAQSIHQQSDAYLVHILKVFQQHFPGINLTATSLDITSNLPQQMGLGSSAALAHAVIRAAAAHVGVSLTPSHIFQLVWEAERFQHGQSSGLDPATVVSGGVISFQKHIDHPVFRLLTLHTPIPLWLVDSGLPAESRKELIAQAQHAGNATVLSDIGKLTTQLIPLLEQGQFHGELIQANERLLEELGVVGEKAKQMINVIEKNGGVAKITGAGGVNAGSGFLLVFHPDHEKMKHLIEKQAWSVFPIVIGQKGKQHD